MINYKSITKNYEIDISTDKPTFAIVFYLGLSQKKIK